MRYVQQNDWFIPLCFDFLRKTRTIKGRKEDYKFERRHGDHHSPEQEALNSLSLTHRNLETGQLTLLLTEHRIDMTLMN